MRASQKDNLAVSPITARTFSDRYIDQKCLMIETLMHRANWFTSSRVWPTCLMVLPGMSARWASACSACLPWPGVTTAIGADNVSYAAPVSSKCDDAVFVKWVVIAPAPRFRVLASRSPFADERHECFYRSSKYNYSRNYSSVCPVITSQKAFPPCLIGVESFLQLLPFKFRETAQLTRQKCRAHLLALHSAYSRGHHTPHTASKRGKRGWNQTA